MRNLVLCVVAAATFGGCAAAGNEEKTYPMHPEDARRILLSADFKPGVIPGSNGKPRVWVNMGGEIEWTVLNDEKRNGWWCALAIESASEDGKTTRVINQCKGPFASERNEQLDELVDAALTDREPKFEQPAG
jgi:hypothetical protein